MIGSLALALKATRSVTNHINIQCLLYCDNKILSIKKERGAFKNYPLIGNFFKNPLAQNPVGSQCLILKGYQVASPPEKDVIGNFGFSLKGEKSINPPHQHSKNLPLL